MGRRSQAPTPGQNTESRARSCCATLDRTYVLGLCLTPVTPTSCACAGRRGQSGRNQWCLLESSRDAVHTFESRPDRNPHESARLITREPAKSHAASTPCGPLEEHRRSRMVAIARSVTYRSGRSSRGSSVIAPRDLRTPDPKVSPYRPHATTVESRSSSVWASVMTQTCLLGCTRRRDRVLACSRIACSRVSSPGTRVPDWLR